VETPAQRRRQLFVAFLTVNSGATDAIGFLALGGAFTSVMTGNLVLFGISIARSDWTLSGHTAAAIVAYVAGCAIGTRVAGTTTDGQAVWPRRVTVALCVQLLIYAGYVTGWWVTGARPDNVVQVVLLSATAVALGMQSAAVQRFGVSGLSSTYMTGTLTTVVVRLSSGHRVRDVSGALLTLVGLVLGAVVAALLVEHVRMCAPLCQLAALGLACIGGRACPAAEHRGAARTESRTTVAG
jgi:uncharacterized membrane protein YoaK (UPF0700 family)